MDVPLPTKYHPEMDDTKFLNENDRQLNQTYIGDFKMDSGNVLH